MAFESTMGKSSVRFFGNANPCGEKFQTHEFGSREFFAELEKHWDALELHIPILSRLLPRSIEEGLGVWWGGIFIFLLKSDRFV